MKSGSYIRFGSRAGDASWHDPWFTPQGLRESCATRRSWRIGRATAPAERHHLSIYAALPPVYHPLSLSPCVRRRVSDDAVVHYLVEDLWVDVDEATVRGMTALHYAAKVRRGNCFVPMARAARLLGSHARSAWGLGCSSAPKGCLSCSLESDAAPVVHSLLRLFSAFSFCLGIPPTLCCLLRCFCAAGLRTTRLANNTPGKSDRGHSRAGQAGRGPGGQERLGPSARAAHEGSLGETFVSFFSFVFFFSRGSQQTTGGWLTNSLLSPRLITAEGGAGGPQSPVLLCCWR